MGSDAMTLPEERPVAETRPDAAQLRTLPGNSGGFNVYRIYVCCLLFGAGAFVALLPWLAPALVPPRPGSLPIPGWVNVLLICLGGLVMLGTVVLGFFRETTDIDRA